MTIQLDFAFLAEWARAEDDAVITAAKAGLYEITLRPDEPFIFYVAGRFSRDHDDEAHTFDILFQAGDEVSVSTSVIIDPATDVEHGNTSRAAFVIKVPLPVVESADCSVTLGLDGSQVAVLPLRVEHVIAVAPESA